MKNNKTYKKAYKKLIDKIFFQTLILITVATVVVLLIRTLGHGEIGNIITEIIATLTGSSWTTATEIYYNFIRRYLDWIILGTILLVFGIFYRMFLSWFTKYFDEIIEGVNGIVDGDQPIVLSPELEFMEIKLKHIKNEIDKSAEMERELEKRKNEMILYLAHDIKTPLTSVIGYLSLLDEIPDMPIEQKAKYVQITLEKAHRLETLINEFFEITRYNLHTVPLHKENIDLAYMMVQIVDEAYPQLHANNKHVSLNVPQDLTLQADAQKMARVFNNLLKNAISYSDANSEIEIGASEHDQEIQIYFKSEGTIPTEKLNLIFDKFHRLDEARQTATGGAGLGLAITKDIIMLHHGQIVASCENNKVMFIITLPNE